MSEQSEQILDMMTEIILQYLSAHGDELSNEHIAVNKEEN